MLNIIGCFVDAHDVRLVALAAAVCALACITAIELLRHSGKFALPQRLFWLGVASIAVGSGIWATHFIAMLAFSPGLPSAYDAGLTGLSFGLSVVSTGIGLGIAHLAKIRFAAWIGGAIVGAGIAVMHYTGMAAFMIAGRITWSPELVGTSVLIAIVLGSLSLAVARQQEGALGRLLSAGFLLAAICGHHFSAMGAVTITPDPSILVEESGLNVLWVAGSVALVSIVLLALACMALALDVRDRRLAEIHREHLRQFSHASESRIRFLAYHDGLTGLPNRVSFHERLDQSIRRAGGGTKLAVICFDLDRFKDVNDMFGHAAGDRMLQAFASTVTAILDETQFVARLGGDEFVILAGFEQDAVPAVLAERILRALRSANAQGPAIAASAGIAIYPDDAVDPALLMTYADAALYRAKNEGRGTYRVFEPAMGMELRDRHLVENDIRDAVARDQLALAYQPQFSVETGTLIGFEALLRWNHPARGLVSPALFIPVAEECGAILTIGEWVLREACGEAARWTNPLRIAVNVSGIQIYGEGFGQLVRDILAETGLDPARLEIEVTETALIRDPGRALATLQDVKALGVMIAIDDFGTGYSSLSNLRAFPFDKIKIDRSFIRAVDQSDEAAAIVRSVLCLGRGLGLPVLAEGVETDGELDFLRAENCDAVQGFLTGRPETIRRYVEATHGGCREADASAEAA